MGATAPSNQASYFGVAQGTNTLTNPNCMAGTGKA